MASFSNHLVMDREIEKTAAAGASTSLGRWRRSCGATQYVAATSDLQRFIVEGNSRPN